MFSTKRFSPTWLVELPLKRLFVSTPFGTATAASAFTSRGARIRYFVRLPLAWPSTGVDCGQAYVGECTTRHPLRGDRSAVACMRGLDSARSERGCRHEDQCLHNQCCDPG